MSFKNQCKQLSTTKMVSIKFFKKRKQKTSSICKLLQQLNIHNNKLNIIDTSSANYNNKEETTTWVWNENTNETNSDKKEKDIEDIDRKILER